MGSDLACVQVYCSVSRAICNEYHGMKVAMVKIENQHALVFTFNLESVEIPFVRG